MKSIIPLLILVLIMGTSSKSAPTVSNVHANITGISDNGKGLKTRTFNVTFDLANTNGKTCRIFPGVRGIERNPVLANEGPYLWYKNLSGDTAIAAGTSRHITFQVVDTAGEFDSVRVKVTAWDRDNWAPWPNRTFNPRHHGWALDVRNGVISSKSSGFISDLASVSPAFLQVLFDFSVFRVMGNHAKGIPNITDYPDESDSVPVPFPHTTLGDPFNAYPEGNFSTGTCTNDGDCHIEIIDVENWNYWSMWRCFKTGTGAFAWDVANIAQYPFYAEQFKYTGTAPVPGTAGSPAGGYRPLGWTSGDAAGLAITPGLVMLDEMAEGEIQHALRSVSRGSAPYYVYPASHKAGSLTGTYAAPMGLRWKLKNSFNINQKIPLTGSPGSATYRDSRAARIILRACQKYGCIDADNSSWSSGYFMAEMDDHQEVKWDSLCTASSVTNYIASAGISWNDFEIVDWEWQYQQYTKFEQKK